MTEQEREQLRLTLNLVNEKEIERDALQVLLERFDDQDACLSIDRQGYNGAAHELINERVKQPALRAVRSIMQEAIAAIEKELEALPMPESGGAVIKNCTFKSEAERSDA